MEIELFTLCEFVDNENGKLTIVNTIDDIMAAKLPWRAYFGVAIKLKFEEENITDADSIKLCIHSKEHPETKLFEADTPLPKHTQQTRMTIGGNIKGLVFQDRGEHCFEISINQEIIFTNIFNVIVTKDVVQ